MHGQLTTTIKDAGRARWDRGIPVTEAPEITAAAQNKIGRESHVCSRNWLFEQNS